MELSLEIGGALNQRDEKFRKWKAESFRQPRDHVSYNKEAMKMMDMELYKSAAEDRFDELFHKLRQVSSAELSSIIYEQVGPSGNSLLHVAASNGSKDVTELLVQHFPLLISRKNFQDDTAFHLAARAGQLGTATILINNVKIQGRRREVSTIMEMKNNRGNTALHDAVVNCHHEVASFLVLAHSEVCYIQNSEHKSPLYLAVESSSNENQRTLLSLLMNAVSNDVDSLNKLQGKSPVHAAVERRAKDIMKQIAECKPDLLRAKDGKGANALHCAASMGYVPETRFLVEKFRDGVIKENDKGNLPIHVASKKGHVDVVDEYISKWTDPVEFLNSKGQNILHVAAKSGKHRMVKYILKSDKLHALINEKDRYGNTPLHLASKHGRCRATCALLWNDRVKTQLTNAENLTSYEVAMKHIEIMQAKSSEEPISNGKDYRLDQNSKNDGGKQQTKVYKQSYFRVIITLSILHFLARPRESKKKYSRLKRRRLTKAEITSMTESLLVVSVLVAGVSFAGVIQLPKSDVKSELRTPDSITGHFQKQADKSDEQELKNTYIVWNTLALNVSVMASLLLCLAQQINDVRIGAVLVSLASGLTGMGMYLTSAAFISAISINTVKYSWSQNFIALGEAPMLAAVAYLIYELVSSRTGMIINYPIGFIFFVFHSVSKWRLFERCYRNKKKTKP